MDVLNMNTYPIHPKVKNAEGGTDYVHIMPKRRVTLPRGFVIDPVWLKKAAKVFTFTNRTTLVALNPNPKKV